MRMLSHRVLMVFPLVLAACDGGEKLDDTGETPEDDTGETVTYTPLSVDEEHHGKTYEDLTLDWYKWTIEQPTADNPALDETGASCAINQSGEVWLLAGFFGTEAITRTCTVPADKALFFPLMNYYGCQQLYEAFGSAWVTDDEIAWMTDFDSIVGDLYASIDGQIIADPFDYHIGPTEFTVTLPEDNYLDAYGVDLSGTLEPCLTTGYWMFFDPLAAGEHTIHFGGTIDQATEDTADDFTQDITYTLTVE